MIHEIKGKMTVAWNEEVKAIIDTWQDYDISLEEFKEAVLIKGLNYAIANKGIAWIIDSSHAKGAFSSQIQQFVDSHILPTFSNNGIKYFITITSRKSSLARMTISFYSSKTAPFGLQLIEAANVNEAIEWLKLQNQSSTTLT